MQEVQLVKERMVADTTSRYEELVDILANCGYNLSEDEVRDIGTSLMEFFEALCGDSGDESDT